MKIDKPFGAITERFLLALKKEDINYDAWAVGAFLVCEMRGRDELVVTLVGLADMLGWGKKTERTLSRVLHDLRDRGWIDFPPPRSGRGSKYVITLVGLDPIRRGSDPETRHETGRAVA